MDDGFNKSALGDSEISQRVLVVYNLRWTRARRIGGGQIQFRMILVLRMSAAKEFPYL